MNKILRYLTFFLIFVCNGCVIVDKTHDPMASSFVGAYFKLVKNGYLYEARCADINAKFQSTELCVGIQTFDSGNEKATTPKDYRQYLEARADWDDKLFSRLAFENQSTIISPIPKGSIFKITRLVEFPWGSNGSYWAIRGNIVSGKDKGQEIEFPTNSVLVFPRWIVGYGVQKLPVFNEEYLVRCINEKCT